MSKRCVFTLSQQCHMVTKEVLTIPFSMNEPMHEWKPRIVDHKL
jgi:hypothetical protein